jgi:hypothetical protein
LNVCDNLKYSILENMAQINHWLSSLSFFPLITTLSYYDPSECVHFFTACVCKWKLVHISLSVSPIAGLDIQATHFCTGCTVLLLNSSVGFISKVKCRDIQGKEICHFYWRKLNPLPCFSFKTEHMALTTAGPLSGSCWCHGK